MQKVLKVHKHEIFILTFFAETETLWSQGPVTWDFWKSYSHMLSQWWNPFRVCSASDEICSAYAQCVMKFVQRILSMDVHVKTVHILPLAEHARKFVPCVLSVRWNCFLVCSVCNKIVSTYAQYVHCACYNFQKLLKNTKLKCKLWL